MEPTTERPPALALPQPGSEQLPPEAQPGAHSPEAASLHVESAPARTLPPAGNNPGQATVPVIRPIPAATDQSAIQQQASNATADDMSTDDLDEEWINKAKTIIAQTKSDPYVESREISKVKADYLKIRYNKQIKVTEDSSR
ncbi:MAG TPA: hypothetical protein VJP80_08395 [Candidatus Saccharimonadales bacterium]|nr:hypothetical protein [Candidatus Saccharimonadales bacterium]